MKHRLSILGRYKSVIKAILGVFFLYFLLSNQHLLDSVVREAHRLSWAFIAFLGISYNVSKIIGSCRSVFLMKCSGYFLGFWDGLKIYYSGMLLNLIVPGGLGGEGYRTLHYNKKLGTPFSQGVKIIACDRISGVLALGVLAATMTVLASVRGQGVSMFFLMAVISSVIALLWLNNYMFRKAKFKNLDNFGSFAFSLGVQSAQVIAAMLYALQSSESPVLFGAVFLVSSLSALVPLTVGGVGLREWVFYSAGNLGYISEDKGVLFSLLFFTVSVVSVVPVLIARSCEHLRSSRSEMKV